MPYNIPHRADFGSYIVNNWKAISDIYQSVSSGICLVYFLIRFLNIIYYHGQICSGIIHEQTEFPQSAAEDSTFLSYQLPYGINLN